MAGNWSALYWVSAGTGPDGSAHGAGELISVGNVVALSPAQITARGWGSVDLGSTPPSPGTVWNTSSLSFVAAPNSSTITTLAFVQRFTGPEWAGIAASTDGNISQFLFGLQLAGGSVTLTSATIQNALTYLVNHALLSPARATAIATP